MPRDGDGAEAPERGDGAADDGRPVARPVWSGSISFGLVTVPVELYSASRRGGVSLRMLGPDGVPLVRQYVCPAEGRPLARDELVRGYEAAEGEYVTVTDEELAELAPRRSRDIELLRFVDRGAIDPSYYVRAYFLLPGGEQTRAYRLLAETMERTGRAAIATFVMRGKAYAVAILADRGILRAETLRFGDELRTPADFDLPEPGALDDARVRRMGERIAALARDALDEAELVDDAPERMRALVAEKEARGEGVLEAPEPSEPGGEERAERAEGGDLVDLMSLLKRRLAEVEGAPATADGDRRRGPRRAARRPAASEPGRDALEAASREELYARAKALDIPGRSKMSRDELLVSIRRAG